MKRLIIFLFFSFWCFQFVFAAFEYKTTSAQSAGFGNMRTVCREEAAAIFYNPVLISSGTKNDFSAFYTRLYGLNELAHNAMAISMPAFKGHLAGGYNCFGQHGFYKEEIIALAYRFSVNEQFKLGISYKSMFLDLGQMNTSTRIYGIDIGFKLLVTDKSFFGVMLSNINRPKIGRKNPEEIYRDFNVGYSIEPIRNLRFMAEYFKIMGFESEYRFAAEMSMFNNFVLRTGFVPKTEIVSIGFGINEFLDYAYTYHFELGAEHAVNLKFAF